MRTSSQYESKGRHALPLCTTTRRITANPKTKNILNSHQLELYGSPITKDIKKLYSSRRVGGLEMELGPEDMQWWW